MSTNYRYTAKKKSIFYFHLVTAHVIKRIVSRYLIIFAVSHFLLLQVSKFLKPSAFTRFVSSRLKIYQVSMTRYKLLTIKKTLAIMSRSDLDFGGSRGLKVAKIKFVFMVA